MNGPGHTLRPALVPQAVLLHAAAWFTLVAHGLGWIGSWSAAVDQVAGSVVIVGPLLAGLVANGCSRRAETALPVLVVAALHPVRGWYGPVVRLWLLASANLVLLAAEALVLVALAGPRVTGRPLLVLLVAALVLAVHALVGMAVGTRLGPRLAGAVAGAVSFGLFLIAVAGLAPACFVLGGATDGLVGERYRQPVLIALGLIALLTATAVIAATGWNQRWPRSRALLALTCVAVAMVLTRGGPVDLDNRFEAVAVPLRCHGSSPQVCLPVDAPRALPAASRGMDRLARPLVEAGVALPDRWVDFWGQRLDAGVGQLSLRAGAELGTTVAAGDLVRSLTMPRSCPAFHDGSEPVRSLQVRLLLERWIAFRNGLGLSGTALPQPWFSSAASETWVRTTYADLRRCDLAALRFPPHAG